MDTFHAVRVFSDPHISVEGENLHILRNDSSMTDLFTWLNFATQVLYFKVKRKDLKERMFVYWREQKINPVFDLFLKSVELTLLYFLLIIC